MMFRLKIGGLVTSHASYSMICCVFGVGAEGHSSVADVDPRGRIAVMPSAQSLSVRLPRRHHESLLRVGGAAEMVDATGHASGRSGAYRISRGDGAASFRAPIIGLLSTGGDRSDRALHKGTSEHEADDEEMVEDSARRPKKVRKLAKKKKMQKMLPAAIGAVCVGLMCCCLLDDEEKKPKRNRRPPATQALETFMPVPLLSDMMHMVEDPLMGSPEQMAQMADMQEENLEYQRWLEYVYLITRVQARIRGVLTRTRLRLEQQEQEKYMPRPPQPYQKLELLIFAKKAKDLPSVNMFGGIEPYFEFRAVDKDPCKKGRFVEQVDNHSVKTAQAEDCEKPSWEGHLELGGFRFSSGSFLQIILWDVGSTGDTPVAHAAMDMTKCVNGLLYDPAGESIKKLQQADHSVKKFVNLMDKSAKLSCSLKMSVCYVEVHTYLLNVIQVTGLPKKIEDFEECFFDVRVVRGDPKKVGYEKEVDPATTVWSGKTSRKEASEEVSFGDEALEFEIGAVPGRFLSLVLIGKKGKTPIGQAHVDMREIWNTLPAFLGGEPIEFEISLEKIKKGGSSKAPTLENCSVLCGISYDICIDTEDD
eukprot:TRINITY_DN9585_c0_g1_i1.p1 TRINITY_DN9585_c0_g1~~TRINITY_DN9585_c0_g1_i1.p1  ORF type:complete len:590 (-),score=101.33 TRINITY_DN9585_c0_g1_i1:42-1811(-)